MEPRRVALLPLWGCAAWGGGTGDGVGAGGRTEQALSPAARPVRALSFLTVPGPLCRDRSRTCHLWDGGVAGPSGALVVAQGTVLEKVEVRHPCVLVGAEWPPVSDLAILGLNLLVCKMERLQDHACSWVLICIPQSPKITEL